MKILAISGSLRKASYNSALLRAAQAVAPEGVTIEIADISGVPLFNEDVEKQGRPAAVATLREQIRSADALLFASPEYNYGISGVLKNAIDWVSRGADQPLNGKRAGIIGASMGFAGTVRAQAALRLTGVNLNIHFLNKPEVLIGAAHEKFDAEGNLTHEATREHLRKFVAALVEFGKK